MDDPDKQMAKRDRKPGWMGGPSSTDGSGSGSSSSQPFGPAFGSDSSGTNASGSASSGGSSYRGQAPDGEPDKVLDITFVLPPRDDQPAQQAAAPQPAGQPVAPQLPLRPGDRVEWVDPLSTDVAPATSARANSARPTTSAPTQQDNSNQPSVESSGPIIRGQEPTESDWTPAWQNPPAQISPIVRGQEQAYGGYTPAATGPDQAGGPSYAAPQPSYAPPQTGPVQMAQVPSYPPTSSPPTYSTVPPGYQQPTYPVPPAANPAPQAYAQAPTYPPAPGSYQLPPPNGSYPACGYPQQTYPPGTYPQYGPAPLAEPIPPPGSPVPGGVRGYYQMPGAPQGGPPVGQMRFRSIRIAVSRHLAASRGNANRQIVGRRGRQLRRGPGRQHRHRRTEFRSASLAVELGRRPQCHGVPWRRRSIANRARAGHGSAELRDQLAKSLSVRRTDQPQ